MPNLLIPYRNFNFSEKFKLSTEQEHIVIVYI